MYLFTFNLHIQQTFLPVFPCGRQGFISQGSDEEGRCRACLQRVGFGDRDKDIGRVQSGDTEEVKEGCSVGTLRKETERALPGSRGADDAGKLQAAEKWHRAVREERRGREERA